MRTLLISLFFFLALGIVAQAQMYKSNAVTPVRPVLVIHGGAGTILPSRITPALEQQYRQALEKALQEGYAILKKDGSSMDAVVAAVKVLEDDSLFNAGKGSVFTAAGTTEMDAAIMDGATLAAGSVAGITTIKNPITAARAVMEKTAHVMIAGKSADEFAASAGCEVVEPAYFFSPARWRNLQQAKARDSAKAIMDQPEIYKHNDDKFGTVGAVALDSKGNLAAATSTGGMTNKKFGRIGDAPIIGAGTYANNATCAISCTGWGEFFIRLVMAKTISDRMEYGKQTLAQASTYMVMKALPALGGDGGLVAVDKEGNIAMPFNTAGMYRGYIDRYGKMVVEIFK